MKCILCVGPRYSGKTCWGNDYLSDNPMNLRFNRQEFSDMIYGPEYLQTLQGELLASSVTVIRQLMSRCKSTNRILVIDEYFNNVAAILAITNVLHIEIHLFPLDITDSIARAIIDAEELRVRVNIPAIVEYYNEYRAMVESDVWKGTLLNRSDVSLKMEMLDYDMNTSDNKVKKDFVM